MSDFELPKLSDQARGVQRMVSITVEEYDWLRDIERISHTLMNSTERLIFDMSQKDSSGRLETALGMLRAAVNVSRFAVANLPAEITRGWPWEDLRKLGESMIHSEMLTTAERETGSVFLERARVMEDLEHARVLADAAIRSQSTLGQPTGLFCPVCGEPQLTTVTGASCEHGHEGPGVQPRALPPQNS